MIERLEKIRKELLKFAAVEYSSDNLKAKYIYKGKIALLTAEMIDYNITIKSFGEFNWGSDKRFKYVKKSGYEFKVRYNTKNPDEIKISCSEEEVDASLVNSHLMEIEKVILHEIPYIAEWVKQIEDKKNKVKETIKQLFYDNNNRS